MTIKQFTILLIVLWQSMALAVNPNEQYIDHILNKSRKEFLRFNLKTSLNLTKQALQLSEINNYTKGIALSKIYLIKVKLKLGDYKGSLEYLQKLNSLKVINPELLTEIDCLSGHIFRELEMYDFALKAYYKQLSLAEKIKDNTKKMALTFKAESNIGNIYRIKNNNDSIKKYLDLQKSKLKYLDQSDSFYKISEYYCQQALYNIDIKDYKKAKSYLQKSKHILQKHNTPFVFNTIKIEALLEEKEGNLCKAEEKYLSLLNHSNRLKNKFTESNSYKVLADFYTKYTPSSKESAHFFYKYSKIKDSIQKANSGVFDKAYDYIIVKKNKEQQKAIKKQLIIIATITLISFMLVYFFYYRKQQLKRLVTLTENKVDKKELEIQTLVEDIKENKLKELLIYANNDHVGFLPAFYDLYPQVITNLNNLNDSISVSEKKFIALIYLNFTTKEIAKIQNVTVRAIQIRKNRLRKKYNIPSQKNFNTWFIKKLSEKKE